MLYDIFKIYGSIDYHIILVILPIVIVSDIKRVKIVCQLKFRCFA